MKVLFASVPITGHVNPALVAARILKNAGHTIAFYTGKLFREKIEAAGIQFFPLPTDIDYDFRDINAAFPERKQYAPGPEQLLFDMKKIFVDVIPSGFRGLKAVLQEFPADLIVHETSFCSILPLLMEPRSARPATAYLGITTLMLPRADGVPFGPGLEPATDAAQLEKYAEIAQEIDATLTLPVQKYTDGILHELGAEKLPGPLFESRAILSDIILQPAVPSFEYPLREPQKKLHFIGALLPEGSGDVPAQIKAAKQAGKKVVLVSQGTVANDDLGKLAAPVIQALGDRDDILILVTTGGKPIESIPCPLTANTVASKFLNFREVLPHVDLLVAFASYGTVTQALSLGVPMVVAGQGEDKPEVGARVAWSGCGINLRNDQPTPEQVLDATEEILSNPKYRARAQEMAREFATHDSTKKLPQLLEAVVADQQVPQLLESSVAN